MMESATPFDLPTLEGCLDSGEDSYRIGIIDIGSNTVRMVVYDAPTRLPVPIFNERAICALGKGLDITGHLDPVGKELAFEALLRFCGLANEMKVGQFRILATAAVRDAEDGAAFAKEVEKRFGYAVKILSGKEEAHLGARGILGGQPNADGLFGDIGGGSLDLVLLNTGKFGESDTLPLGHLRVTEAAEGSLKKAQKIIDNNLSTVKWLSKIEGRNFYAVGGIWRVIARIYMQQNDYPLHLIDNLTVDVEAARDLTEIISKLSKRSLQGMIGIAKRRADTLPFSALTLNRILKLAKPKQLIFSGYGLREGQFFELLPAEMKNQDPLISACEGFANRSGRFALHGAEILNWVMPLFPEATERETRILKAAALLSDIGWTEHPDYRALHSFIRILRLPVAGISHRDRAIIAMTVFFRYNGPRGQYEVKKVRPLIRDADQSLAIVMGAALRLAHVLSAGVPGLLAQTSLTIKNKELVLDLGHHSNLFKSEAVIKLAKYLADTIEVKLFIKAAQS